PLLRVGTGWIGLEVSPLDIRSLRYPHRAEMSVECWPPPPGPITDSTNPERQQQTDSAACLSSRRGGGPPQGAVRRTCHWSSRAAALSPRPPRGYRRPRGGLAAE